MRKSLDYKVIPELYEIDLNVEENYFKGKVSMHLFAENEVNSFSFNSKNLKLSELMVDNIPTEFFEKDEVVTVQKKVKGNFLLSVKFESEYSKGLEGFYKSKYNDENLYSTHFEPSDARQAFPCFDQPDMKAKFLINITVPEGNIALSNNELDKKEGNTFYFKETVKMSTYLVAWVIGKLDYIEDNSRLPIRLYAAKGEVEWGRFALDIAVKCIVYFEKYFGAEYPLPKLDMVAIPSFAMGAMENWGLITFRKTSLLFDKNSTSIRSKKNIAVTVCHELAHMWFGNLVTMKWWDDLWLNEGFATWAATLAIENSAQDILRWDAWTSFINDDIESGMSMDSLKSTHKIETVVNDPVEIDQIFDAISYSKGASIIKMIENWLGPEEFKLGLMKYIKKFKYKNTETLDLWESLNKKDVANEDSVQAVIDPWTKRPGFPYITVQESDGNLILTQQRFTLGHEINDEPWPIPVKIKFGNKKTSFIMREKTVEIKKEDEFYKINDGVSGFYRVLYSNEHLQKLLTKHYSELSKSNILNLFSDQFAMIFSLKSGFDSIFKYFDQLKTEYNYEIMSAVISNLFRLRSIFYFDENMVLGFEKMIKSIISDRAIKIDLKLFEKDINQNSLNSLLIASAVKIGNEQVIEKLSNFDINDYSSLNPEYQRSYFISIVDSNFNDILNIYRTSKKPGEKQSALFALGATNVEKNIDFMFENFEIVEPYDVIYLFASLGGNINYRNKIAGLFIKNFNSIKDHVNNFSLLRHCIEYCLDHVIQAGEIEKIYDFLESISKIKELKSAYEKTRDSLNIALKVKEHFKDYSF